MAGDKIVNASGFTRILQNLKASFSRIGHTHTKTDITDFPAIPTKTSDLTNDSGFITSATSGVSGVKGNEESSYRTGNVNLTTDQIGAVNWFSANGIKTCSGNGQNLYFRIGTIHITSQYINRPLAIEISQRAREVSTLQITFYSRDNTDPDLNTFTTSDATGYYIKKTATSTWELYGQYAEVWGLATVHRVYGCGANIGFSLEMVNIGTTAPTDTRAVTPLLDSRNLANVCIDWSGSYSTGSWMLIYNGETGANGGAKFKGITPANVRTVIGAAASSHTHTRSNITDWRDYCTLTLLWTNSSPSSTFAAQTIYLSQSAGNFRLLIIDVCNSTSGDNHFFQFMNMGVTNKIANPGYSGNAIRTVTISGTSVAFSVAQHGSSTTANGYAIPYKIWGLI